MNKELAERLARLRPGEGIMLSPIQMDGCEARLVGNATVIPPYEPLMHYMKLGYFIQVLETATLRVKRLDTYKDDPFEGLYPQANATGLSNLDTCLFQQIGSAPKLEDVIQQNRWHRKSAYIHCWYGGTAENRFMWEHYGDNGKGVCLRTTASRLESSVSQTADFVSRVAQVTYIDENTPIPTAMSFLAFCRKRPQFVHEKEFRLLAEIPVHALTTDEKGHLLTPDESRQLRVNLERLLEAVVTGPNLSNADRTSLEAALAGQNLSSRLRTSEMAAWL
jgi:hypothetical protein